jgi:hypothetical protein
MEDNLFLESLQLIFVENNNYNCMIQKYIHINEESEFKKMLTNVDVKKIIKYILRKFKEILDTLWNKFRAFYHQFTSGNRLLSSYRKKLENINWDVKYPNERFIYTNLDNCSEAIIYDYSINSFYDNFVDRLDNMKNISNYDDAYRYLNDLKSIDVSNILNLERGKSIGKQNPITTEEYPDYVIKYYKNTVYTISANTIMMASEIKTIANEFYNSKTIEKSIVDTKNKLQKNCDKIINRFEKLDINQYTNKAKNIKISNNITDNVNKLIKQQCDIIQGICNIYIKQFSIKLEMFKEYKEQQMKILLYVIRKSIAEGKM